MPKGNMDDRRSREPVAGKKKTVKKAKIGKEKEPVPVKPTKMTESKYRLYNHAIEMIHTTNSQTKAQKQMQKRMRRSRRNTGSGTQKA